jgi:hypothetical protein
MKKVMFAAAMAAALAATAEIESANTVGYTSKDVTAGKFYLIGTQFDKAGTTSAGSVDMNDLIKLSSTITAGLYSDDFATAPKISVLNAAGGYDSFYYISDGTDDKDDDLGYDCWCDLDGYELDDSAKLALGKGFWFTSPTTSGTITTVGQVSEVASTTLNFLANKYTILCNPYPVAVALQSLTTSATPGLYSDDFATAPKISVVNAAGGYDSFYYISDGTDDNDDDLGVNAWCDLDGYELSGTQIDAGAAFWMSAPAAGSVTFSL